MKSATSEAYYGEGVFEFNLRFELLTFQMIYLGLNMTRPFESFLNSIHWLGLYHQVYIPPFWGKVLDFKVFIQPRLGKTTHEFNQKFPHEKLFLVKSLPYFSGETNTAKTGITRSFCLYLLYYQTLCSN